MSYGNIAPYLPSRLGREERFATGSLLFDLERAAHRHQAEPVVFQNVSRKGGPSG